MSKEPSPKGRFFRLINLWIPTVQDALGEVEVSREPVLAGACFLKTDTVEVLYHVGKDYIDKDN